MALGVVMLLDVVAALGGGVVVTLKHGATTLGVGASTVCVPVCLSGHDRGEFQDGLYVLYFVGG